MSKTLPVIIGVVLILAVGGIVYMQSADTTKTPDIQQEQVSTNTSETDSEQGSNDTGGTVATSFTAAQVAAHDSASSCWTIIDANVYDLTQWIAQHPGGPQAIQGLCGRDGTATFRGQHGTAQRQADILVTFKIGALAQ